MSDGSEVIEVSVSCEISQINDVGGVDDVIELSLFFEVFVVHEDSEVTVVSEVNGVIEVREISWVFDVIRLMRSMKLSRLVWLV